MIAISDLSRDDVLSDSEYLRFCNRLGNGAWSTVTNFADLPSVLVTNYQTLSQGGSGIPVGGSKPGQTPTTEQSTWLQQVCTGTDQAIAQAQSALVPTTAPVTNNPPPSQTFTTTAPAPATTPTAPTTNNNNNNNNDSVDISACTRALIVADMNRDGYLDQTEYVRFLNRNAPDTIFTSMTFPDLPANLQANFQALSDSNGQINVQGSKPNETPTEEQKSHIQEICTQTAEALAASQPTTPPDTTPAGIVNGTVTVHNAFTISNRLQMTAKDVESLYKSALDTAYANFIQSVLNNDSTNFNRRQRRQLLRSRYHRNLQITGFQQETAKIYLVQDVKCPSTIIDGSDTCQTAYASFDANFVQEASADAVSNQLSQSVQSAIDPILVQAWANEPSSNSSTIVIHGPFEPVLPDNYNSNELNPDGTPSSNGQGPDMGRIVAGLIIIMFFLGGAGGAFVWYRRKKKMGGHLWTPRWAHKKTSDHHTADTNELDGFPNNSDADQVESAPPPFGRKNTFTDNNNNYDDEGDEDDDGDDENDHSVTFSVDEDLPVGIKPEKKNNLFGRKKKKSDTDEDIHVLDPSDAFGDFGNYDFEPPQELQKQSNTGRGGISDGLKGSNDPPATGGGRGWNPRDPSWGDGWNASGHREDMNPDSGFGDFEDNEDDYDEDEDHSSDFSSHSQTHEYYGEEHGGGGESRGSSHGSEDGDGGLASKATNVCQLDALVDNGDWVGVMETAAKLENNLKKGEHLDETSQGSSDDGGPSDSFDDDGSMSTLEPEQPGDSAGAAQPRASSSQLDDPLDETNTYTTNSMTSEEIRRRDQYRIQVEDLVRKAVPEEWENIPRMMDQFAGREAELINTLQTIYQRTESQRRLKGVHKSKGISERNDRGFGAAGAEGSAVIAAASMISVEQYDDDEDDDEYSGEEESGQSYDDDDGEELSYYDDDDDGQEEESGDYGGTYDEGEGEEVSFNDDGDYDDEGGSYEDGDRQGEYDDEEGKTGDDDIGESGTGSYYSEDGTYSLEEDIYR